MCIVDSMSVSPFPDPDSQLELLALSVTGCKIVLPCAPTQLWQSYF